MAAVHLTAWLFIGYVVGSCPWGLWLGRWVKGVDVRTVGSKNMGATNVYRSLGPALGLGTLVLDAAKGALPVWLATRLPHPHMHTPAWIIASGAVSAGLGAVLGHVFSFWTGFRGGKGVATTAGVLLALAPLAFAAFAIVFVATVAVSRFISVGSTLGALAFFVTLIVTTPGPAASPRVWLGALLVALIVWRHRENYARLARGEERPFSLGGGRDA
ncbi:MAG: glycerol-3-phosphate 1-O-acyltransferase PlsY [Candidatus Eisenbacteria bacterium]|uniref:Glycerol-3-phosphate acyltransferase n=1 Tax=Eiseniibacteriota bacterium TaxID=2212470 RepID=A0A9D6QNN4_UNCEI|nr:glycerol-3-phosphate 1-O-acyltransferase PlsY [Candidatus Eisenbacteria bacterium]MBI3539109.1 glycerol-3-phosphate 1-O-acyltransferase PlsY [Candidatus Eisenbacteria bacterium]